MVLLLPEHFLPDIFPILLDGNAGILLDVIEDIAIQIVQAPGQGFAVGHIDAQIDVVTVAAHQLQIRRRHCRRIKQ